jgi:hypothetical protein
MPYLLLYLYLMYKARQGTYAGMHYMDGMTKEREREGGVVFFLFLIPRSPGVFVMYGTSHNSMRGRIPAVHTNEGGG